MRAAFRSTSPWSRCAEDVPVLREGTIRSFWTLVCQSAPPSPTTSPSDSRTPARAGSPAASTLTRDFKRLTPRARSTQTSSWPRISRRARTPCNAWAMLEPTTGHARSSSSHPRRRSQGSCGRTWITTPAIRCAGTAELRSGPTRASSESSSGTAQPLVRPTAGRTTSATNPSYRWSSKPPGRSSLSRREEQKGRSAR
jgi:hypothetical protein